MMAEKRIFVQFMLGVIGAGDDTIPIGARAEAWRAHEGKTFAVEYIYLRKAR